MSLSHQLKITNEHHRLAILSGLAGVVAFILLSSDPIQQDARYHLFADDKSFGVIPNWQNVLSNLPFAVVGLMGLQYLVRRGQEPVMGVPHSLGWALFFTGVFFTAFGSGFYHWHPDNFGLFWDRLPMTVGFSGFFAAVIGERVGDRIYTIITWPLTLLGLFSAVYWIVTESYGVGDLRMYAFVQFFPLLAIPMLLLVGPPKFSHSYLIMVALALYGLSKLAELKDHEIWEFTNGVVSGHALKHLVAAMGCYCLLIMLKARVKLALPNLTKRG